MNFPGLSVQNLLEQLLTSDYGGMEHKRRCLLQLLEDTVLIQTVIRLLEKKASGSQA